MRRALVARHRVTGGEGREQVRSRGRAGAERRTRQRNRRWAKVQLQRRSRLPEADSVAARLVNGHVAGSRASVAPCLGPRRRARRRRASVSLLHPTRRPSARISSAPLTATQPHYTHSTRSVGRLDVDPDASRKDQILHRKGKKTSRRNKNLRRKYMKTEGKQAEQDARELKDGGRPRREKRRGKERGPGAWWSGKRIKGVRRLGRKAKESLGGGDLATVREGTCRDTGRQHPCHGNSADGTRRTRGARRVRQLDNLDFVAKAGKALRVIQAHRKATSQQLDLSSIRSRN